MTVEIKPLASGSSGNCYHLTDGSTPLLLECGIPFREIRRRLDFRTSDIAACLVTHEHQDHCMALDDVLRAGIDVYASKGTIEAIGIAHHRLRPVEARRAVRIGTWNVMPFETKHNAAEPFGFLMASVTGEKVLFVTDTYYIRYKFRGLTHIMIECNYSRDVLHENVAAGVVPRTLARKVLRAHFSLENVKEFFRANDLSAVQEIWLIHLSDRNADAERFKREIQAVTGKPVYIA